MSSATAEKRGGHRVALDGEVRGEVMVFQPMLILDISRGGAQIETAFALRTESTHDFRLSLGDRAIIVRGRIAYCQIGELTEATALYRSGVAFVDLSQHASRVLDDFVGALGHARSARAAGL